eukprot:scaffold114190_cov46-Prasinocladus_malaysianus.AAC.4
MHSAYSKLKLFAAHAKCFPLVVGHYRKFRDNGALTGTCLALPGLHLLLHGSMPRPKGLVHQEAVILAVALEVLPLCHATQGGKLGPLANRCQHQTPFDLQTPLVIWSKMPQDK